MPTVKGEFHHSAKLTRTKVRRLRHLYYEVGLCVNCSAKLVGCPKSTAYDAIIFKTWKHIHDADDSIWIDTGEL